MTSTSGGRTRPASSATRSPTTATTTRCSSRWTGTTTGSSVHPGDARGRRVRRLGGRHAPRTWTRSRRSSRRAGVAVIAAKPEEAADRRVVDFVHFVDPAQRPAHGAALRARGRVHAAVLPAAPDHRLQDRRAGPGPLRDASCADLDAAAELLRTRCSGFGVSDWIVVPGMGRLGAFMHCNTRHHSLAFFANPQPRKKIHHVMMEYTSIDDVGTGLRHVPRA